MDKHDCPVKHESSLSSGNAAVSMIVAAHEEPAIGVRNRHINVHLRYNV